MLFTIQQDDERREHHGLQNVIDKIEQLIHRNPKDKELVAQNAFRAGLDRGGGKTAQIIPTATIRAFL
jgi:hypothetical protein